jgi:hypothetical protein
MSSEGVDSESKVSGNQADSPARIREEDEHGIDTSLCRVFAQ